MKQPGHVAWGERAVVGPARGQFAEDDGLELQVKPLEAQRDLVDAALSHDSAPTVFR
jgi:hypothetical protein